MEVSRLRPSVEIIRPKTKRKRSYSCTLDTANIFVNGGFDGIKSLLTGKFHFTVGFKRAHSSASFCDEGMSLTAADDALPSADSLAVPAETRPEESHRKNSISVVVDDAAANEADVDGTAVKAYRVDES